MGAPELTRYSQGEGSVDADGLNTFEQTCNVVAELREFIGDDGMQVFLRGLNEAGDGGAGVFYWVPGGTEADDGVNVIVPNGGDGLWLRLGVLVIATQTITDATLTTVDLTTAYAMVVVAKGSPGSPTTLNLPATPIPNAPITVQDGQGDAVSNPITVSGNGALINGAATNVINVAYRARKYVYNTALPIPGWLAT